jgi:hypothetical protein
MHVSDNRVLDVEIDIHGKLAVVTMLTKIVGPQALRFTIAATRDFERKPI